MSEELTAIDLTTVGGGAAIERFKVELDRALWNIADPNTEWKKPRKIVLTVTIQPNEQRKAGFIGIDCSFKPVPNRSHHTPFHIRRTDTGELAMYQVNPDQGKLELTPKVVPMGSKDEEEEG